MAQSSWPFENIDTSETQFSQWARHIGEGVAPSQLNELAVYADSSGMVVKVPTGQAMVRGHYYSNTAEESLVIAAADVSNPRIDAIVLQLDPSANTIVLTVLEGTPAGSPVAPTLTQTDAGIYQLLLATVEVGAGATAIDANDVTDLRTFLGVNASDVVNTVKTVSGTTYTLVAEDKGKIIRFTSSSAVTLTVNDVLAQGERVDIYQKGTGLVTFTDGAGVTLEGAGSTGSNLAITEQYAAATILCDGSGVYAIVGKVAAV